MPRPLRLLDLGLAALLLGACQSTPRKHIDRSGWQTHCFGRVLVDLPPQAQLKVRHEIAGFKVERLPASNHAELLQLIDQREAELKKKTRRRSGAEVGTMFERRERHPDGSITLHGWKDTFSRDFRVEHFLFTEQPFRAYTAVHTRYDSPETRERARTRMQQLTRTLRPLPPGQLPTEAGVCIDGGYFAGNDFPSEDVDGTFRMAEHPGMHFSISADTGEVDERLLERVNHPLFRLLTLFHGTTLRKAERTVDVFDGAEYLSTYSEHRQRGWAFTWEYPGNRKRRDRPSINVELIFAPDPLRKNDQGVEAEPPPPPFRSTREALDLWDGVLGSLRLRPGAI